MSSSGRSQERSRLDESGRGLGIGRIEEELRLHSLGRCNRSDDTITLLYHGSCSRCHHFHRHVAFEARRGHTEHTRFHCERCHHLIFGLGRTDTQNSLASQDSFPVDDGIVDFSAAAVSCSDNPELPLSSQLSKTSHLPLRPDQLNATPERPALGLSRPTSAASETAPGLASSPTSLVSEPTATRTELSAVEVGAGHQAPSCLTHETKQGPVSVWYWICKIVGRLARWSGNAPHELRFLGLRLQYRLTSDSVREIQPSSHTVALQTVDESLNTIDIEESTHRNVEILGVGALSTEPVEENDSPLSYSHQLGSISDLAQQDYISENSSNQQAAKKRERLRIERREKTLDARALQQKCHCTEKCHCKRQGSEPPNSGPSKHSSNGSIAYSVSSRGFQWSPAYPLGDLVRGSSIGTERNPLHTTPRLDPFTHVGGSHSLRWTASETPISASIDDRSGGSGQSSSAMSNTSSVSLHPRRPILPGRSLSASLLSFSPSSAGRDFGTRNVFRSLEFLHHARAVAAGPNPLPWPCRGGLVRMVPYDWAIEATEDGREGHSSLRRAPTDSTVSYPLDQESHLQVGGVEAFTSNSTHVHGPDTAESELIDQDLHTSPQLNGTSRMP